MSDFIAKLVIPPEEADKLRQHDSFIPAMEEILKQNWSLALQLLEKVLQDKPKSKYTLLLKAWCMVRIMDSELVPELGSCQGQMEIRFRQGIFDEKSFDRIIDICNSSVERFRTAKEILKCLERTYPSFAEAKKLGEYVKKLLPKLTEAANGLLDKHFEMPLVLSPREFENFIAYLFRKIGYKAEVTSYAADFGADVIAEKGSERIVIQVKRYVGSNVGAKEVQQTLGSIWKYKADKAIVVTTTDFTKQAIEQAKEAPIELWNINTLRRVMEKHLLAF